MLGHGVVLLLILGVFFNYFYGKYTRASVEGVFRNFSERIVAHLGSPPELDQAKLIAKDMGIEIRYEGPERSWATSEELPPISETEKVNVKGTFGHSSLGPYYFVVPRSDGGVFLIQWNQRWDESAHTELLIMLLLLVGIVVAGAYHYIRRTLKPLQPLRQGVLEITEGNLDVHVPVKTGDEIGELSEAFNRMVTRIRQMIAARDQLLGDISHELRSPITRMKVALEFIPESEKKKKLTSDLLEIESMITGILEIERLKNGRAGLKIEEQDVISLIKETADQFDKQHPGIDTTSLPGTLNLSTDSNLLKVVIKNILENAIKFSTHNSESVQIKIKKSENQIEIIITDDGQGIPEDDLPHVFEPFYRVDRSRSRQSGGYGLGLSMCRKIINAIGGEITCTNNPNSRGTTFKLLFGAEPQ